MKIKKILTFVFAAALMTSCGNEDGPGGDGGNGGGTEHTEYFGVNMSGSYVYFSYCWRNHLHDRVRESQDDLQ